MNTEQEREAFEAWAREYSTYPLERDDEPAFGTTGYTSMEQTMLWDAWQARAALAATPAAPQRHVSYVCPQCSWTLEVKDAPVKKCRAGTSAAHRCANGPIGCDYPRCDCNGASTKESNQ